MGALNHNKRMNAGFLHEILIRELARAIVSDDPRLAAIITEIINESFSSGTLADELAIHEVALESRGVSRSVAERIVGEIKIAGARLDRVRSGKMKRQLVGRMTKFLGEESFDLPVNDYKAHASVDLLIQKSGGRRISEAAELTKIEEYLVGYMSSTEVERQIIDPGATRLAYGIAIDSYEREYGKSLDEQQRELLSEHVRVSLGGSPVGTARKLERHRRTILAAIEKAPLVEGVGSDKEMIKRLTEAARELRTMDLKDTSTKRMERLMLFHDLRREIEE